jgi:HPt (histidine-containing phosphotransfer) domain-containing protein
MDLHSDDLNFHVPPELVKKYISRRQIDITECETALESYDFNKIAHLAHQMKGNGASFGFAKISEVSGELEAAAKNQDTSTIKTHLQELSHLLHNAH